MGREGDGKGKKKGREGEWREGKGKGFAGPISNCFLRTCQRFQRTVGEGGPEWDLTGHFHLEKQLLNGSGSTNSNLLLL